MQVRTQPRTHRVLIPALTVLTVLAAVFIASPAGAAPATSSAPGLADGAPSMPSVARAAAVCSEGQSGAAIPRPSSGRDAVRTTIGVAKSMGVPLKGQIIAVMVMYQETSLRNLANDGTSVQAASWPAPGRAYWMNVTKLSLKYPHDRFGARDGAHDTDSIGLYQQRPAYGWGNYGNSTGTTDPEGVVQRLLDPRWEAMAFFGGANSAAPNSGLLDIVGWAGMSLTLAANAVQGSNFPGLYAQWEGPATTYVNNNQDAPAIALPWYPGGGSGALACTSIPTDPAFGEAGHNPRGYLDTAAQDGTDVVASGWSFDPDAINAAVAIQISDTGPAGFTRTFDAVADLPREDVAAAYNLVGKYGYMVRIATPSLGTHTVCVTAINIGRGTASPLLGCATVEVFGPDKCRSGTGNPTPSGVGAARTDSGTVVVVRGADDQVWLRSADPSRSYAPIGGRILFGPAVASWGGNRLDVFAIGTDQRLYHNAGSTDGPWGGWQDLGGTLTTSPAVVSFAPGQLTVYSRGGNGELWTISWTGNRWTDWSSLGGDVTSAPGAVVDRDSGHATVGARASDGRLWELRFDSQGQSAATVRGITLCSAPGYAARTGDGDSRISVIRSGAGGLVLGGLPVGGFVTSAPALVLDPTGRGVAAFARGGDNALWTYAGAPGAGSWFSLGGILN